MFTVILAVAAIAYGGYWAVKFQKLQTAIEDLYYGHRWNCDTLTVERQIELWERVRDAAGFKPGETKKRGG